MREDYMSFHGIKELGSILLSTNSIISHIRDDTTASPNIDIPLVPTATQQPPTTVDPPLIVEPPPPPHYPSRDRDDVDGIDDLKLHLAKQFEMKDLGNGKA
ncbi:hypothetical protein P8452_65802 [Trifolium repens]|nr:hypothetical protein P8452_65802 [Trifolium repens]